MTSIAHVVGALCLLWTLRARLIAKSAQTACAAGFDHAKFDPSIAATCAIYSSALDITDAANTLAAEGHWVEFDDLATVTPYLTHTLRRMGDLVRALLHRRVTPVSRPCQGRIQCGFWSTGFPSVMTARRR